jgi:sialic acid synthase
MNTSFQDCGVDCVKFQKSSLADKFTAEALDRPYTNPNSFGPTYGDHKRFLEFSLEEYEELIACANKLGILFSASAMDPQSLKDLIRLDVPFIKIGSGDANNFPMLHEAAAQPKPLIISTGMQTMATIDEIHRIMVEHGKRNFCLMHCISSYPAEPSSVGLRFIEKFAERYPDTTIGYSGHELGIGISMAAVVLGAKVIERHFTLDRTLKGTDHSASLTPDMFAELVKAIRRYEASGKSSDGNVQEVVERLLPNETSQKDDFEAALKAVGERVILDCEWPCRNKLGKSLVYAKSLPAGHTLTENDLWVKVSGGSVPGERFYTIVGQKLTKDVMKDTSVQPADLTGLY